MIPTQPRSSNGKLVHSCGLILLALLLFRAFPIFALTPEQVLIVYNSSLPASKEVALHYQSLRNVPDDNLAPLDLPDSETIRYEAFKTQMAPAIKTAATRLMQAKIQPIVLLVYGTPLIVAETEETPNDQALKKLINSKIDELENLVIQLTDRLEYLAQKLPPETKADKSNLSTQPAENGVSDDANTPSRSTDPLKNVVVLIQQTTQRMSEAQTSKNNPGLYIQISSIIIRMTGVDPAIKTIKKHLTEQEEPPAECFSKQPLLKWNAIFKWEWAQSTFQGVLPNQAMERASLARLTGGIAGELTFWKNLQTVYNSTNWRSTSVDSELCLILRAPHQRVGWLPNPFYSKYNNWSYIKVLRQATIRVARLDASTPELAKRLVDDAIEIENKGLDGIFYIDARGLAADNNQGGSDYVRYDRHLVNLHDLIQKYGSMPVVLNQQPELFQDGDCPNAALYCGWYSLAEYVDAFKWQKGAVGWHIASGEAKTLKNAESNVWCKRMIEDGVAATLGPVSEPYLASFPRPDLFFPLLMTGKATLLEVYYSTLPHLSWRQVLIGDPLYNPFKQKPAIDLTLEPTEATSSDNVVSEPGETREK